MSTGLTSEIKTDSYTYKLPTKGSMKWRKSLLFDYLLRIHNDMNQKHSVYYITSESPWELEPINNTLYNKLYVVLTDLLTRAAYIGDWSNEGHQMAKRIWACVGYIDCPGMVDSVPTIVNKTLPRLLDMYYNHIGGKPLQVGAVYKI